MAVIENGQSDARHGAVLAPGEQPSAAARAEYPVEPLRRRVAGDLAFDGKRFLIADPVRQSEAEAQSIVLVLNWAAEIK